MGADKVKHFVASAAIQSLAYAAFRQRDDRRGAALWKATVVTAGASLGKELLDRRRGGSFSGKDLVWDAAGAGAATVAIIHWPRN